MEVEVFDGFETYYLLHQCCHCFINVPVSQVHSYLRRRKGGYHVSMK